MNLERLEPDKKKINEDIVNATEEITKSTPPPTFIENTFKAGTFIVIIIIMIPLLTLTVISRILTKLSLFLWTRLFMDIMVGWSQYAGERTQKQMTAMAEMWKEVFKIE